MFYMGTNETVKHLWNGIIGIAHGPFPQRIPASRSLVSWGFDHLLVVVM
jgi:hypothetical protein